MITKITMKQVASFKAPAVLETNKRVNLVYGLNGTGKSTISNYMYDRTNPHFSNCSVEGINDAKVLVYNRQFIDEYFYESENLKGIFTLSKENKKAEQAIKDAERDINNRVAERETATNFLDAQRQELVRFKQQAENKCWEIKTTFCGGDRVLEYCLEGLKGQKDKLFAHISALQKPIQEPKETVEQLKKEVEALQGADAQKYEALPILNNTASDVEADLLLKKTIIGNQDSPIADLIQRLGNSDWVKEGIGYIPDSILEDGARCPFCQAETITDTVKQQIVDYFDDSYEQDISALKSLQSQYKAFIESISAEQQYISSPFIAVSSTEFKSQYAALTQLLKMNATAISTKLRTPSQNISLEDSTQLITDFNSSIQAINDDISRHNSKIDNKDTAISDIKACFWSIMRWKYDQTISAYQNIVEDIDKNIIKTQNQITVINGDISTKREVISEQQKMTVNVDEAVSHINNGLLELGIDSFRIKKHSDIFYRIIRDKENDKTFRTLSEGEKMIITFLYFVELCIGKDAANDTAQKKIVVIDDPISSLSHIYVFNIGQLIKRHFTVPESTFEQIFVFTHCLYFFYELCFNKKDDRDTHMNLFRIIKNTGGSNISTMHYHEIQNDYQTYWHVIKDEEQAPALIANCMRNIMEYFFGFIEKAELNNVFQKQELKADKYQAFYRYMNRESHSIGQNVFDIKEFDYQVFKDAFKLVFETTGYDNHYNRMMK